MDIQSLETFVTLAEYRNFTKTADALFIAQSTVTNRIADLEAEIGHALFWRNRRKVILTAEGELFLDYARRIIELSKVGIQEMNAIHRYAKTLHIGTTNTIYECHLFGKIRAYIEEHPEEALKITIGHSAELLSGLQDRLFDVVYSYIPFYKAGYCCERFAQDNLVLVTRAANHTYQEGITRAQLAESDYLYCNFALQEVGRFIRELFPPYYQFRFEIDHSTRLVPYLLTCDGISFLPQRIAQPWLESGELRCIRLLDFEAPKINCYKVYRECGA